MATEIELKAWVDDHRALKNRLSTLAEFGGSFTKEDTYWFPAAGNTIPPSKTFPPSGLRIRQESRSCEPGEDGGTDQPPPRILVTFKSKEIRDNIEINDEWEFEISRRSAFEELLLRLGLEPGITKTKRGWNWKYGDITVELCRVEGIGWFLELEILADNDRPETIADGRSRLLDFLGKTGTGTERIETRYYTEMLKETRGEPG